MNKYKLYFTLAAVAAAVSTVLETLSLVRYYDGTVFLYKAGATFPTIEHIVLVVSALLLASSYFTIRDSGASLPAGGAAAVVAGVVSALLILAYAAISLYSLVANRTAFSLSLLFEVLSVVFCVPAVIYLSAGALKKDMKPAAASLLGLGTVVFLAACLMRSYFGLETPMNDPVRIFNYLSLIVLMFYLLFEVRYTLNIEKPELYRMFSLLSLLVCPAATVPVLYRTLAGRESFTQGLLLSVIQLSLLAYIIGRNIRFISGNTCNKQ